MGAERRQFTPEFNFEAVRLAERTGKPLSQAARELGIRSCMLRSWMRLSETRTGLTPGDVFPGNGKLSRVVSGAREVETVTSAAPHHAAFPRPHAPCPPSRCGHHTNVL